MDDDRAPTDVYPLPWTVEIAVAMFAAYNSHLMRPGKGLFRRERYLTPFLEEFKDHSISALTMVHVEGFLDSRRGRSKDGRISSWRRREYLRTLREFFLWLEEGDYVSRRMSSRMVP